MSKFQIAEAPLEMIFKFSTGSNNNVAESEKIDPLFLMEKP